MSQPKKYEILADPLYLNLMKNTFLLIAKNDPLNFSNLLIFKTF
ncbi:hypothetical protein [Borreliella garinii]|nr:hypothetical protein [Borreliella garinii]